MYFWTIQSNKVVDIISREGCYYPDIQYVKNDIYKIAYKMVLYGFNNINESSYNGLIFGFAKKGENNYFQNVDELYEYFLQNPQITNGLHLWSDDHVLLQLKFTEEFNMIPINFNDFIYLMDFRYTMPPHSYIKAHEIFQKIVDCIKNGINKNGITTPSFTQIHAPFIKMENIENVYGNFNKRKSDADKEIAIFPIKQNF